MPPSLTATRHPCNSNNKSLDFDAFVAYAKHRARISLTDALAGNCGGLAGADDPAPLPADVSTNMSIKVDVSSTQP